MKRRYLFFVKDGDSNWSGLASNVLTEKGKADVKSTACSLMGTQTFSPYDQVPIFSSRNPRPFETAQLLSRKLHMDAPRIEDSLGPIGIKNPIEAVKLWKSFSREDGTVDNLAIDAAYGTDPRFETSTAIETRSEIRQRFEDYLRLQIDRFEQGTLHKASIHVSHHEVLYHLVTGAGFVLQGALNSAELIEVDITSYNGGEPQVLVTFRGGSRLFEFSQEEALLGAL